jgi:glycolate oxidase
MALPDQYKSFEDIVGPENISSDPVILYPYSWRSGLYAGIDKFTPRFEAALLPQSTEEVQAIVRLCNRFKLQFKASSTGWGPYNDATGPGVIKIDLRRMNRILEINERNMYAVLEPYVVGAQLQAELMKRGLICNQCGAGTNCSALPIAAHQGIGHLSQSASYGERNQLALEWVTPDGEIVRLGTLGSSDDWFCGDGQSKSRLSERQRRPPWRLGGIYQSGHQDLPLAGTAYFSDRGSISPLCPQLYPGAFLNRILFLPFDG